MISSMYIIPLFFTALASSFLISPIVIRFAKSRQILDHPDTAEDSGRRVHTLPTPRLGGIAIVAGFFLSVVMWKVLSNMAFVYLCSFCMFFIGLRDDIKPLPAKLRLILQFVLATSAVYFANLSIVSLTFTPHLSIHIPLVIGFLLSVFIIMGSINSINMIDGLDGLAGGVVLISISLLSYLHYLNTRDINLLIVFSIPIIGAVLGFLKYNTHPSSLFMGDSGSNWLGFMMGIFFILVTNGSIVAINDNGQWNLLSHDAVSQHISSNYQLIQNLDKKVAYMHKWKSPISFLSIMLCLSIPIFDTGHVILRRIFANKNPMTPDKQHFHHSLMRVGLNHSQSVFAVYFLMVLFGILGILPVAYPQYSLDWVPFIGIIILCVCLFMSQRIDDGFIENIMRHRLLITNNEGFSKKISQALHYWENVNRYIIYIILIATPVFAGVIPSQIGYAALLMCFMMIFSVFFKRNDNFLKSFFVVMSAIVLLIVNNSNIIWVELMGQQYNLQKAYNGLFICLAVSITCFFIVTFRRKYLVITPTDFLLAILPLILLLLPNEIQAEYKLNVIALRSLVLFAALRTLGIRHDAFFYKIHILCIIALGWVALTSLFGLRLVY